MAGMYDKYTDWITDLVQSAGILPTVLLSSVVILVFYRKIRRQVQYNFPPGPWGLPILGYLPFLGSEPYKVLDKLKHKYGSVFGLYFGTTYVVILGDDASVKEAFSKSTTLDRPEHTFDFIPDGAGFSSVNGMEWVEQRRFSLKVMRDLGLGKSEWEKIVQSEVDAFVKIIADFDGQPVNFTKDLTASVSNNVASLIFGRKTTLKKEEKEILDEFLTKIFQFFSQSQIRNFFPILFDALTALGITSSAKSKNVMTRFNQFIKSQIDDLKNDASRLYLNTFVNDYLKEMHVHQSKGFNGSTFNERNLNGNVQALFLGGSETTRTSISWLLLAMASNTDVQEEVHKELDSVIGRENRIWWSDRFSLPYTMAVILEAQRWRTITPLNTARFTTEDITLNGYDILKGTTIIANYWGLHNDENYWKNPEKFLPDRFFLENGRQVNNKPESYVPFSYGKRKCPGETVAMIEILLYFGTLMQKFKILPPEDSQPNLNGLLGLTYQTLPQELRFITRE